MVGIFPPPVHGMSLINDFMYGALSKFTKPYVINLSPNTLNRSWYSRLLKLFSAPLHFLAYIFFAYKHNQLTLYLGLSGGYGQIYDIFFVIISKLFGVKIYLHHHSYRYLTKKRYISQFLFSIAGIKAVHIVACESMRSDLLSLYSGPDRIRIISGIGMLSLFTEKNINNKFKVNIVGFLSNLTVEKGVLEYLNLAELFFEKHPQVKFILAGPFQDEAIRKLVELRISKINNVEYVGALYGIEKNKFFQNIDVFIFPTRYHNESEGLVLHEALSQSVPVIAIQKGCVNQVVNSENGLTISDSEDFPLAAMKKIEEWIMHPSEYQRISLNSYHQSYNNFLFHRNEVEKLCYEMLSRERI